ncbi:metal-dependent amidase/aminoacylase/carboxypeptidase family protein [Neisseria sp. HSC-16F19]|nr:hypothetical protein [Neisseria sp. HSC-16F19]MCP2041493.1 metal-dependent amidase/aminoacylase/carboxypeptidase family protein [Neisseria sp. HSC-16F19]
MLRKTAVITAALLTLSACGGGGSLPSSCKDALKAYAKLAPELQSEVKMSSRYMLESLLKAGDGDAGKAFKEWNKQAEAQYEAMAKTQGKKTAKLLIEETEKSCRSWQKDIDAVK